jgi:hypothetical protein
MRDRSMYETRQVLVLAEREQHVRIDLERRPGDAFASQKRGQLARHASRGGLEDLVIRESRQVADEDAAVGRFEPGVGVERNGPPGRGPHADSHAGTHASPRQHGVCRQRLHQARHAGQTPADTLDRPGHARRRPARLSAG